ncbi:hypothetical protein [Moorena producens]
MVNPSSDFPISAVTHLIFGLRLMGRWGDREMGGWFDGFFHNMKR